MQVTWCDQPKLWEVTENYVKYAMCVFLHQQMVNYTPPYIKALSSKLDIIAGVKTHCCLAPCKSVCNHGPLTEPKIYSEIRLHRNFNFKRPYLGNDTRFFRSAGAKILV